MVEDKSLQKIIISGKVIFLGMHDWAFYISTEITVNFWASINLDREFLVENFLQSD